MLAVGCPTVPEAWCLKGYEFGLREDGVVVWREVEVISDGPQLRMKTLDTGGLIGRRAFKKVKPLILEDGKR